MAKDKSANQSNPTPTTQESKPNGNPQETKPSGLPAMPEGFAPIGIGGPQKWHVMQKGNAIQGVLLSREVKKNQLSPTGEKVFYRVQITAGETLCSFKNPETKETTTVAAVKNDIVCMDQRGDLVGLDGLLTDNTKQWEIWLCPLEKVAIGGGQTFWRYRKGKKQFLGKLPPPNENNMGFGDGDEEHDGPIPF